MKTIATSVISVCMVLAAGTATAQDAMKKTEPMAKGTMTMQQCKDHMAMAKKDGMKKDDAMMKMDTACADMMKKDGMKKDMPADPMKK